jgi:hypothetical protein
MIKNQGTSILLVIIHSIILTTATLMGVSKWFAHLLGCHFSARLKNEIE